MAVSNGIFTMKAVNDETTSALLSQLGGLLGVAKRSDGRYHLADFCSAGSICKWARNHPFAYNSDNFDYDPNNPSEGNARREAAKASVCFGFSRPQLFTITSNDLSHAPYVYNPPRGRAQGEPFRIRDFDGYKHDVSAPIAHNFNNARTDNKIIREDVWEIYVEFPTQSYGVAMRDIVPTDIQNFRFCLVIIKQSTGKSWVLPTNKFVKDYTSPFAILVVPNNDYQFTDLINNQGAIIWDEMNFYGNEGDTYTVAVAITSSQPNADHTAIEGWADIYSLELVQSKDRRVMLMSTKMGLDDLTGYTVTQWLTHSVDSSTQPSPYQDLGIITPNSSQKLTIRFNAGDEWYRTNCYIAVKMSNLYGPIIYNGETVGQQVMIGGYLTIGRNGTVDWDLYDIRNCKFYYPKTNNGTTIEFEVTAYYNEEMSGTSKLITTFSHTFSA